MPGLEPIQAFGVGVRSRCPDIRNPDLIWGLDLMQGRNMVRETQDKRHALGVLRYDAERRRVWICGRRMHHGLTGALLAAAGLALMAHDWSDRSFWFRLGA